MTGTTKPNSDEMKLAPAVASATAKQRNDGLGAPGSRRTPNDLAFPSARPRIGDLVGRYVLVDKLGSGGMGTVFSAYDPELQRTVALKLLSPSEGQTPDFGQTLLVEGRALAQLHHQSIVPIYDVGTSDHGTFIAMKQIEGVTLGAWVQNNPRSRSAILEACVDAAQALAHAHKHSVVHGDFKPSNVMVEPSGTACVVDFGLSRRSENSPLPTEMLRSFAGGTPAYMAPEQHLGGPPSEASDQFSFCVTVYELLCGTRPFAGATSIAIAQSVLEDEPIVPDEQDVPRRLWRVLAQGLSRKPEQRFTSMDALVSELRPRPRTWRVAGIAAGAIGIAATLGVALKKDPCATERAPVHAVWSDAEAGRLEEQFASAHGWPSVRGRLQTFAQDWAKRWVAACTAREEGSVSASIFDRRQACLGEHLADARGLISTLSTVGLEAVEKLGPSMVLDSGVSCDDDNTLLQRAPRPSGAEGSEYDAVIAGAADVFARAHAGVPTEALWEELEQLSSRAQALEHPRPQRYAQRVRAKLLRIDGRNKEAGDALAQAFRLAEVAEDDIVAMRMARSLSFLHAGLLGNVPGAVAWLDIAKAKRERVPNVTAEDDLILMMEEARIVRELGHNDEAIDLLDRALEFGSQHGLALGDLMHDRGMALHLGGRAEAAIEAFRDAASARTEAMGPEHVLVGQSLFHLARALHEHGDLDTAELELQRAIEVFEIHPGALGDRLVARSSLAIFAASRGDTQLAISRQQAVIEEVTENLGDDSPRLPALYSNLARMLMMEGRLVEGLSAANGALQRGGPAAETVSFVQTWSVKAEIELKLNRPAASLKSVNQALLVIRDEADRTRLEVIRAWVQAHLDCDLDQARATAATVLNASALGTTSAAVVDEVRTSVEDWSRDRLPEACSIPDSAESTHP